jgi:hypothetical protein
MMLSRRSKDSYAVVSLAIVRHTSPTASETACEDCL